MLAMRIFLLLTLLMAIASCSADPRAVINFFTSATCRGGLIDVALLAEDSGATCKHYNIAGLGAVLISVSVTEGTWHVQFHSEMDAFCLGDAFTAEFAEEMQCLSITVNENMVYAYIMSTVSAVDDYEIMYATFSEPTCTIPDYSASGYTSQCMTSGEIGATIYVFPSYNFLTINGECDTYCEQCSLHNPVLLNGCLPVLHSSPQRYIYAEKPNTCQETVSDFSGLSQAISDPNVLDICITEDIVLPSLVDISFIDIDENNNEFPRKHLRIRGAPTYRPKLSSSESGFVIRSGNQMHVFFENLIFEQFTVSPAIISEPDTILSIKDCEFKNLLHGAIFVNVNSHVAILQSIFEKNTNNHDFKGGSITAMNAAQLSIIETEFVDSQMNTDDSFGAAIYVEDTNLHMEKVSCHDSTYASSGGCLYALNSEVTILESNFYNLHSNDSFDDSEMQFRSGKRSGAAIMSLGEKNITITGCDFTNNSGRFGAVVYSIQTSTEEPNYSTTARMMIDECTFTSNTAATGAAILGSGKMLIQNSVFHDNKAISWVPLARGELQGYGGAIMSFGLPISIENCEFDANIAEGVGGAIAFTDWFEGASMELDDCKFTSNIGRFGAGAISYFHLSAIGEVDVKPLSQVSLTISDTEFHGNRGENHAIVPNLESTPEWAGRGGAITIGGKINATISNCIFDSDFAAEFGSAIFAMPYIDTQKVRFTIEDTQFIQDADLDVSIVQLLGISGLFMRKCTMEKKSPGYTTNHVSLEGGPGVFNACTFKGTAQGVSSAVIVAVTDSEQKASNNIQIAMGNCMGFDVDHASNVIMRNADALLTFNTSYTSDLIEVDHSFDTDDNILLFCSECEQRNPFLCNAVDFCSLPVEQQASIMSVLSVESASSYIQASSSSAVALSSGIYISQQYMSSISVVNFESSASYIQASSSSAAIFLSSILEDSEASSVYMSSSSVQYSIRSRLSAISYQESTSAYEWSNSQKDDKDDGFNIILAAAAGGGGLLLLLLLLILVLRRRKSNRDRKSNAGSSFMLNERSPAGNNSDLSGSVMPMMSNPSSHFHDQNKAPMSSSSQPVNDYEALHYDKLRPAASDNVLYADLDSSTKLSKGQEAKITETEYTSVAHPFNQ